MIDVMIITYNESLNLPHCLEALQGWTNKIFVIDSGSTDGTQDIARSYGAEVVHHDWPGYAQQKNWGLENLPFEADWILIVDADEVITEQVRKSLLEVAEKPIDEVPENGFFVNRLTMFMGRPIRRCGYFPSWNLRFFKRGKGRYEDREVHEHVIIEDPVGFIKEPMIHDDRRGLEHYVAKHNRYSTLEVRTLFSEMMGFGKDEHSANVTSDTRRRRWLKRHVMPYAPFPGFGRFIYMYIFRLGVLDGRAGLEFCKFISMYDSLVALKLRDLRRAAKSGQLKLQSIANTPPRGLVEAEGTDPVAVQQVHGSQLTVDGTQDREPSTEDRRPDAAQPPTANGQAALDKVSTQAVAEEHTLTQMQPEASPWTFREKVGRAIWMIIGRPIFRMSFHNWYGFRARLLRFFGAKVGRGVAIRPTANIEVPWMIEIDDDATVGDYAILYSLGLIRIGKRSIISQYAHLCAGTHDYADRTFKLIRTPVTIGDDAWIGADAFIGPGVTVGKLTVVGARSSTYKDLPARRVCVGNPAKPIKERVLR